MTRIILTVGCVGKTYLDNNYVNVYDFDKHTLDYKYDKTGYEHLTNEEFKSLPGRTIKDGWFERYMKDWCKVIDSGKYDVVTGWLQDDCVDYLVAKGYKLEVVLVDVGDNEEVYKERSVSRGNNLRYWENTAVVGGFKLTHEMVHDAWSMVTISETNYVYHKFCLPYTKLSKEVQDLDAIYTKKLNNIVTYLSSVRDMVRGPYE